MEKKKFRSIEEYHAALPKDIRKIVETLRAAIQAAAPQAEETISYNMPAFKQEGVLVFYAVNKNHIGFYPTPSAIVEFASELVGYETSKGAIQFPMEKKLPLALVKSIVKFRVKENLDKAKAKSKKK